MKIILMILPLPLAGCGQQDEDKRAVAVAATMPIPIAYKAVATPPPPVPTARRKRTPPMPVRHPVNAYRASGTEPFWSLTIRNDYVLLDRPDHPPLTAFVSLSKSPNALRYVGDGMTVLITPGPCNDGMSDTLYGDRVQLAFSEGTLKGCGGPPIPEDDR